MAQLRALRFIGLLLVAVLVLGAGTAVAVTAMSGGDANSATGTEVTPPQTVATLPSDVSAEVRDSFAVFRRPASSADRLDADLARRMRPIGANPDLARILVDAPDPRHRYYAVPGRADMLCFVDGTGSGSCLPASIAAVRGTLGSDECAFDLSEDEVLVYGLAPDGIDEVRLTARNGDVTRVTVADNMWKASVARRPADARPNTAEWVTRSGTPASYAIPYSPDVNLPCR